VLCLDKDNGGMLARTELIGKLGIEKCSIINTKDCKDANSFLQKYGKESLQKIYDEAQRIIETENDVDFIFDEANIDNETKLKPYKIIFGEITQDEAGKDRIIEILTSGNLSMLMGKEKSRKTFSLMALCKMILSNTPGYVSNYDEGIVLFDTEQYKHHSRRFYKRLSIIADISKFKMLNLRAYDKQTRTNVIKKYIEKYKPTLAIIDNIRDVIVNFNDIEQTGELMTVLSNLSENTETHILSTLHVNKNDKNARGHLGAELTQKVETAFIIETDEDKGTTDIQANYYRNEKFSNISFELVNGLPQIDIRSMETANNELIITKPVEEDEPF